MPPQPLIYSPSRHAIHACLCIINILLTNVSDKIHKKLPQKYAYGSQINVSLISFRSLVCEFGAGFSIVQPYSMFQIATQAICN